MGSCDFCKKDPTEPLKSCVCHKAAYCSKECQAKDWKTHKPSCPPFIVRESPGKGRGLFATRKIKEGEIILEEYPLLVLRDGITLNEIQAIIYPNIDEETKAKILQLHDPADDIKNLDTETVEKIIRKKPIMKFWREARSDEMSKIFRIITCYSNQICGEQDLYNTTEGGLYIKITLINHSCVPNATMSWVMGDFQRKQVRAIMVIKKDQEILVSYRKTEEFIHGAREFRRQALLELHGFVCDCSECSLVGEDLEENERMRAEIRETGAETHQLIRRVGFDPVPRKDVKKAMKLAQRFVKLIQTLNLREGFVSGMLGFYHFAIKARSMNISCENDPDIYKQEALKYAKMFGDDYIHFYKKSFNN